MILHSPPSYLANPLPYLRGRVNICSINQYQLLEVDDLLLSTAVLHTVILFLLLFSRCRTLTISYWLLELCDTASQLWKGILELQNIFVFIFFCSIYILHNISLKYFDDTNPIPHPGFGLFGYLFCCFPLPPFYLKSPFYFPLRTCHT